MTNFIRDMFAASILLVTLSTPALAAPKDCSMEVIPDTPVRGVVNGKPFVPNEVGLHITKDGMQIDQVKFDRYELSILAGGIFNALTVNAIFRQGTRPDGHVFRRVTADDIGAQPMAGPGTPEIQGWDLQLEAANVDTDFTQTPVSLRLEYGARKGDIIPGKIYFCAASAKTEIMGTFNAKVDQ